jgi:hypothetical protein
MWSFICDEIGLSSFIKQVIKYVALKVFVETDLSFLRAVLEAVSTVAIC